MLTLITNPAAVNPFLVLSQFFTAERDRWLLWTPVGMGLGIITYFALPFEPSGWFLTATPVVLGLAYTARWRWPLLLALSIMLTFVLGFNAAQMETRLAATPMLDRQMGPVRVTGRLMFTEVMPQGVRLTLKDLQISHLSPEKTPVKLRIKLNNKTLADVPPTGSRISLWAQIGPFSDPVEPGANDFRWQGYFKQMGGLGWSYSTIDLVDTNPPSASWRDDFNLMFERARLTLAQHVYARLSGDTAAMTATRLNGEQTAISEPVIQAMRIAGLAHLLSTSGFHVTIMGLLVYFPLRALLALIPWVALRFNIKKIAAIGAIMSAMGYTFLVGAQPATLRSLLMTSIAMFAIVVDRRSAPMRLVMLSAVLAMLIAPSAMLGPSFQMSFAAVFLLIATHENPFGWLQNRFKNFTLPEWVDWIAKYLGTIMLTSLIATAATTPFAIYHFQTFSFYGFIANMLAIPMTSLWVMPCILIAYLTVPFGLDGWFIDGAGAGIWVTIKIAELVAAWPYSILYLPAMPVVALGMIVLGGLWLCVWRRQWRYLGLVLIAIGAAYPLYTPQPDFMVTADGKEWAARLSDGRLAVSNLDHDHFIIEQWQQRLGNVPVLDIDELPPEEKQLRCDAMGCVYHHGTHLLALPILESAALEDCQRADMIVTPYIIRDCAAKTVIDDPELWHHGAHTITFIGDEDRVTFVRDRRGERPWSPGFHGSENAKPDSQ